MESPVGTPLHKSHPSPADQSGRPNRLFRVVREALETAIIAIIIFVLVRSVVLNFEVSGESMLPTFQDGERVLVNRNAYQELDLGDLVDWIPGVPDQHWLLITDWGTPQRGDTIVFIAPEPGQQKPYIKRVIGIPGDHVQILDDNTVSVNGITLTEHYTGDYETECRWSPENCDIIVAEGTVFVLGDHRDDSEDSRFFGLVPEDRIIGKAWLVYWPSDEFGTVDHPEYPELTP